VLAELTSSQGDLVVAYRGGHRWVQSFEAAPLEPADGRLPLEQRGVYLITGGLGGIGLALARHLAERWQARLVLTGRSPVPEREEWAARLESGDDATRKRIRDLLDLEARGRRCSTCAPTWRGERTSRPRCGRARALRAPPGPGPCAGVAGGGVIPLKDPAAAARVMAPKVQGTLLLEAELGRSPSTSCCSARPPPRSSAVSARSTTAGPTASSMLMPRRAGSPWAGRVVSVNWDAWKEVGMAVNTPVSGLLQVMRDFQLKLGISPGEGIDAFNRILAAGVPQVAVFTMDLRPGLARLALGEPRGAAGVGRRHTRRGSRGSRGRGGGRRGRRPREGSSSGSVAQAFEKVLGRRTSAPTTTSSSSGADSLTAIQAIAVAEDPPGA